MIVIYAEKPDIASKIAAALDKITLKDGTEVTYDQLEQDSLRKRVVAQRTKDQYLKIHYMNEECFVIWGVGHLCSLKQAVDYDPNYRNWRNIPTPFLPNYEIKAEKRTLKLFQNAKQFFHQADLIVNATDDDREGELIFHYVYQLSGATTPFQRVVLHEQTEQGFREAFLSKNLKSEAQVRNIALAGCARANIDALYGWNLTKDMTLKFAPPKTVYSIGRVQTPTLRILVDRENEILQFQPEDYYVLQGTFQASSGEEYTGIHESKKIKDRSEAENLLLMVQGGQGTVTDVTAKDSYKEIPLLYDLAALQADANAMYGFSAAYTQQLAQSLYDKGYTTYPRTESRVLNDGMEPMVIKVLSMLQRQPSYQKFFAGRTYQIGGKRFFDSTKVDSHYAIVPTGMDVRTGKGITAEEGKLFDLIARSVIRLTYRRAVIRQMEVITEVNGECFYTKGTAIKDPQWICVGGVSIREKTIPNVVKRDVLNGQYAIQTKQTKPPKRYTDKTLLEAMKNAGGRFLQEERLKKMMKECHIQGIGRSSTRAETIEKIIRSGYVERAKGILKPTPLGCKIIDLLPIEEIKSVDLTAEMEGKLNGIAKGTYAFADFMAEAEQQITDWSKQLQKVALPGTLNHSKPQPMPTGLKCPACGKEILKYGWGWGCEGYQAGCRMSVGKTISGRTLSDSEVRDLLAKHDTGKLSGFLSKKTKKQFSAHLVLRKDTSGIWQMKFQFD